MLAALTFATGIAGAQQHEQMQLEMQPGAEKMKVSVKSPADGARISGDNVTLQVATSGFKNRCDLAGKADQAGTGHYHVLLDKSLIDMYCGDQAMCRWPG